MTFASYTFKEQIFGRITCLDIDDLLLMYMNMREEKKGNGKGFVKVEVRDGVCRMQFRLSGVYGQETLPCEIYGYVREEEKRNVKQFILELVIWQEKLLPFHWN